MSLAERASELRERINKVRELKTRNNITENAKTKAETLQKHQSKLAEHRKRVALLGLPAGEEWPDATSAQSALVDYLPVLEQVMDPSSPKVEAVHKELNQVLAQLEASSAKLVEQRLKQEWSELTSIQVSALQAWKPLVKDSKRIDETIDELKKLVSMRERDWLKQLPDKLEASLAIKKRIMAAVDALIAEGMPEAVKTFLDKARVGTATIEHFTEEVKAWLTDRQQIHRVSLSFK